MEDGVVHNRKCNNKLCPENCRYGWKTYEDEGCNGYDGDGNCYWQEDKDFKIYCGIRWRIMKNFLV